MLAVLFFILDRGDDLLLKVRRYLIVTAEFHRKVTFAMAHGTQDGAVGEQFGQRHFGLNGLEVAIGHVDGAIAGVNTDDAYPGMSYVADSPGAAGWSERLGHPMHEVLVETTAFVVRLMFHDLRVTRVAVGDPWTRTLTPLDAEEPASG